MSVSNLLDKFSHYDLQEVSSVLTELNNICNKLNTICSRFNIKSHKDLVSLQLLGETSTVLEFNQCMSRLRSLQKDIDFLFIEGD